MQLEDLSKKELVECVDIAVDALKQITDHHHECPTRGSVRWDEPHDESKCRRCIASVARARISEYVKEVPF